ncbi:MAG: type II toxin-antitoxin system Phd/YefM family antitoxin [Acidimicrobiales bacterium]
MTEVLAFSDAKAHLSELAERVEREHERILVTRNGRPSFVLMSPDDLDSLEETLDVLRDPELVASLARSRAEQERGESLPLPEA